MIITPDTTIILLDVPLTLDNKNQLTFESQEQQFNYFYNLPKTSADNCSYMRTDGVIRYPRVL